MNPDAPETSTGVVTPNVESTSSDTSLVEPTATPTATATLTETTQPDHQNMWETLANSFKETFHWGPKKGEASPADVTPVQTASIDTSVQTSGPVTQPEAPATPAPVVSTPTTQS